MLKHIFYIEIWIEIIVDMHAVVGSNRDPMYPLPSFSQW